MPQRFLRPLLTGPTAALALAATLSILPLLALPAEAISPEALPKYTEGVAKERANDFRGAEQAYRTALALDPYDSLTYIRLADLVSKDDRKDEAISLYKQALTITPQDTMIQYALGSLYESRGRWEDALNAYRAVLGADPKYAYANLAAARVEKRLNHNDLAVSAYRRFLTVYPQHVDAQRELAALQLTQKDYGAAADTYRRLKAQRGSNFKDSLPYGVALNQAGKPNEALSALQGIPNPSSSSYAEMARAQEALGKLPEASESYGKAIALAPTGEADNLYLKQADVALGLNKPDDAIKALSTYHARHPENAKVSQGLGDLYVRQKDYAKAITLYKAALDKLPQTDKATRADVYQQLGYAYQVSGQMEAAATTYETALSLEDNRQTRLNLALTDHQLHRYDQALMLYRGLLSEQPDNPTLRHDMGQVLRALGDSKYKQGQYPAAMSHYQDALLLGGDSETPALLGMANAQYAVKNTDIAYSLYQRVLAKDPANHEAQVNLARLEVSRQNYLPAMTQLRDVVAAHPDDLEAYRLMASTADALGDSAQALTAYQKALALKPDDAALLLGEGNTWRRLGKLDDARKDYEAARNAAPQDSLIHYNLGSLYNLQNRLPDSVDSYRKALALNPALTESYYGLATTLEKQRKPAEALAAYKDYVAKSPADAAYLATAKARIQALSAVLTPKGTPAGAAARPTTLPPLPGAKPTATKK